QADEHCRSSREWRCVLVVGGRADGAAVPDWIEFSTGGMTYAADDEQTAHRTHRGRFHRRTGAEPSGVGPACPARTAGAGARTGTGAAGGRRVATRSPGRGVGARTVQPVRAAADDSAGH